MLTAAHPAARGSEASVGELSVALGVGSGAASGGPDSLDDAKGSGGAVDGCASGVDSIAELVGAAVCARVGGVVEGGEQQIMAQPSHAPAALFGIRPSNRIST